MVQVKSILMKFEKYDDIKSDLPENPDKPEAIPNAPQDCRCIPDITARKDKFTLFEVETTDSINDPHTTDQWTLFANYAQENDAVFKVLVPKGAADAAQKRLDELNIQAEIEEVIQSG